MPPTTKPLVRFSTAMPIFSETKVIFRDVDRENNSGPTGHKRKNKGWFTETYARLSNRDGFKTHRRLPEPT